jgi:endoribonuclease LACTB2
MRVSDSVRAVQVPDENPMHPTSTNIYMVGNEQVLTIDSGEAMERYKWMLRGYLAATEKAEIAIAAISHHHSDHSGNLKWAKEIFGAEVAIPSNAKPLLKGRLPATGVSKMSDGQVFDLGAGVKLRVLETPGHSVDSVCYYLEDEGVLFTGDTILGNSTTVVGDLGAYMDTLSRLLELPNLKVICPGHGPLVEDPRERLRSYVDHRNMRERQIIDALGEGGAVTSWDVMLKLYPDIDKRLRRAADGNVRQHLKKLGEEGRVTQHAGKPRKPSAKKKARQAARLKERQAVIRKGERTKKTQAHELLRAQENPSGEEWIEPPKFELEGKPGE